MIWFDKSVMLLGCIVEVFLLFDYFRNFFEFRLKKKTISIIFIVTCFALFGINLIGNATVNLIMFPLLMWTFVSVLFESKVGVRIGYFVIAYLVMIGVEFLYAILSQTTSNMVLENGVVPVSDYGWQIVVIKFINFIAFLILKQTSDESHSKMTNKLFSAMVYEMMGWDLDCRYKMQGYKITHEDEIMYIFDLLEPEIYMDTKRKKKKVESVQETDINVIPAEMTLEQVEEKKKAEIAARVERRLNRIPFYPKE